MISILHTADWHLGQTFFSYDRVKEHTHFLDWLKQTILKEDIDVLLISGDIFDVSNPSAQAQNQFYRFIQEITTLKNNIQIVVTAGNHDSASRLEAPLPLVQDKNTFIKGLVPKVNSEIDYDQLIIPLYNQQNEIEGFCLAVPFLRQGDYPKVDSENPHAAGIQELYMQLIQRVNERRREDQSVAAMGHLQAIGSDIAKNDYSEKLIIGGLESVSPNLFKDINYTALGHIHKAQKLAGCEHIRYSGSPLPMSFAEKYYKHGVVKVVLDKGKTVSIDKIEYSPLVKLISIPDKGAALPQDVLDSLSNLPIARDGDDTSLYPYLEVRVLLEEPEPMLVQKISVALEDKAVRLTRIPNEYRTKNVITQEYDSLDGLQSLEPIDLAKKVFLDTYKVDMSDSLLELFQEVYYKIEEEEK